MLQNSGLEGAELAKALVHLAFEGCQHSGTSWPPSPRAPGSPAEPVSLQQTPEASGKVELSLPVRTHVPQPSGLLRHPPQSIEEGDGGSGSALVQCGHPGRPLESMPSSTSSKEQPIRTPVVPGVAETQASPGRRLRESRGSSAAGCSQPRGERADEGLGSFDEPHPPKASVARALSAPTYTALEHSLHNPPHENNPCVQQQASHDFTENGKTQSEVTASLGKDDDSCMHALQGSRPPAPEMQPREEASQPNVTGLVSGGALRADPSLWPIECEVDAAVWRLNQPVQRVPDMECAMSAEAKERVWSSGAAKVETDGEKMRETLRNALRQRCRSAPASRGWYITSNGAELSRFCGSRGGLHSTIARARLFLLVYFGCSLS
jgi:hypothetical protein